MRRCRAIVSAVAASVICFAGAGLVSVAGAATITEFALPTADSLPRGITAGPDGALWFTESAGSIGRITPDAIERVPPDGKVR